MRGNPNVKCLIAQWRDAVESELANTHRFINGLCEPVGVEPPHGSRTDDSQNDYVFERRVSQDNGDDSASFGRIDCYKRDAFILEASRPALRVNAATAARPPAARRFRRRTATQLGFKCRSFSMVSSLEPNFAASGMMVQPSRSAAECQLEQARERPRHAAGLSLANVVARKLKMMT